MNEEAVSGVLEYFREVREQQASKRGNVLEYNHKNMLATTLG